MAKTIKEINEKIKKGEVVVATAEEIIDIVEKEGVINEEAARAKGAGLLVVMDKCMLKEHRRLQRQGSPL